MATCRVAAGIVVREGNSVLMVRPAYKDFWDVPGGYVEPGESPKAACVREIHEELGLSIIDLQLASVDWAPSEADGDKLLFLFVSPGMHLDASKLQFPDHELLEARYVSVEQLAQFTIDRLARRLAATITAIAEGKAPVYLEHGSERTS